MSDTRLINKIAWFLHPENLEDCENDEDLKKKAKEIIKIVRKKDELHARREIQKERKFGYDYER